MQVHVIHFFEALQAHLEQEVKRVVHVRVIHSFLDENVETGCHLHFYDVGLLIFQMLNKVADQIVLELEQVRRVDLDDVLEGLVGCRSDALVRTLCIQFRVGLEEFFSWRGCAPSPKCLENFPCHHNDRQAEV